MPVTAMPMPKGTSMVALAMSCLQADYIIDAAALSAGSSVQSTIMCLEKEAVRQRAIALATVSDSTTTMFTGKPT